MLTRRDFGKTVLTTGTALLVGNNSWSAEEPAASPAQESAQNSNPDCDLLIKGGTVVDPGQHLHAARDVAVRGDKILEVSENIPESRARKVLSAKGKIVTPGLIDVHVHCFEPAFGMNADHYCLARGTTTVVDAGSTGYLEIGVFAKYIIKPSLTRIHPLVNIKATGTVANSIKLRSASGKIERDIPDWIHPDLTAKAAMDYRPDVVGIKARIGEDVQGNAEELEVLRMAVKAAEASHLPIMVHLDEMYTPLPDFLKLLRKGDVFTHFLNDHKHGVLDANGKILPEVKEARARGVMFDVGEGIKPGRVSFDVADKCFQQGFFPDTISSDLAEYDDYAMNTLLIDLPNMVSKFMALGMDLDKALECVTVNPTKAFDFGVQIGTLRPGSEADISIFELQEGNFPFYDNRKTRRMGRQKLVNNATVCRGQVFANRV
jgi:dihydroorotase